MKKITLLAGVALITFATVNAQTETGTPEMTTTPAAPASKSAIEFKETTYAFGEIKQGEKVTHVFNFRNSGTEPLILSGVRTSCGCTVTEWPQEPIPPNGEGVINATFNSAHKSGKQHKTISVTSNASNGTVVLVLTGSVTVPAPPKETIPVANPSLVPNKK